jgi:hypothetical protein
MGNYDTTFSVRQGKSVKIIRRRLFGANAVTAGQTPLPERPDEIR